MSVTPGPCVPLPCPEPTEIDCILVDKVFDYCFESDTVAQVCGDIPETCTGTPVSATCSVTSATCTFTSSAPSTTPNFILATFVITVTVAFTITTTLTTCTTTATTIFTKTVLLCGPTGTVQTCEILSAACAPPAIIGDDVCTQLSVCETFESTALVKLLIPTYGYCSPAPCQTIPLLPCPPFPLFPPQCT